MPGMDCKMIFFLVFGLSAVPGITPSNTVTSPQIRILDVATKASETRLIPHSVKYRNPFHPYIRPQNRFDQASTPLKSYVIYDDYPLKIFKEWKATPTDFPSPTPHNYIEFSRQPNADFATDFYGQHVLPPPKPTLAYRSVYSNVIKVFDDSLEGLDGNRFDGDRYVQPYGDSVWKTQPLIDYEPVPRRQPYHSQKLPQNFPNVFSPNTKFHLSSFDDRTPQLPPYFHPREGFYSTHTINYNTENEGNPDEVEILSQEALGQKSKRKPFLCSFIRVNQRQFPENGVPCGRSDDDLAVGLPEYPDYSKLPDHEIPVEHRRQHYHMKRIKRSESSESKESRKKRDVGLEYDYSGWGSPLSYEGGYDGYFSDNYPSRGGYRGFGSNYGSRYYRNRDRNQNYRNTYNSGSRYDEYDDDDQNDDSNSRGLSGYLTNGGRRYKNRKNNDDEDEDDDNNNDNNRDNDSDEEMERMNSNRRENDRRTNEDPRDRRRNNGNNNNNNDEDDYRDNRRNNNRNNNSRRYNSSNRRYNNDRYDYNSNRNRYYSNSNGYGGYGGYGSTYGGYGSGGYGSGGYGSGGYGSSYGNNGGYGYGGYGNGFGTF